MLALGRRVPVNRLLVAGLALFGLASIGCGLADSLAALIPLRVLQGLGGALVLCASLPMFAAAARPGDSPLYGWSAAAAIGAAVGPAAGGALTQLFTLALDLLRAGASRRRGGGGVVFATSRASAEPMAASESHVADSRRRASGGPLTRR